MNDGNSKTPYNSIYEALNLKNQKPDSKLVCCKHGFQCAYGKKPTENVYVNLASPSKEQQVAEKLAAKLGALEIDEMDQGNHKNKKRLNREKRKKKVAAEENHAYELIGPFTEGSTLTSAPIISEILENNTKCDSAAFAAYIGIHSTSDAEAQVTKRGEFALYHQFESSGRIDNLSAGLPLMLVYYTTTKKHRHYPVRSSQSDGQIFFSVDCGYPTVRKHYSLDQLVQYYKTFGSIQNNLDETSAEAFSWWLE